MLISIIVILLLAAGGGYALWQSQGAPDLIETVTDDSKKESSTEREQKEAEDTETGRITEDQVVDNDSDDTEPSSNDTSNQSSPEKPEITRANQRDDKIKVAAIFDESSNGQCILRVSKEGEDTIKRTADIMTAPSYYACDGFSIPVSEFPSGGRWSVTVTHKIGEATTKSEVKYVEVTE